jgi:hypothetical protein
VCTRGHVALCRKWAAHFAEEGQGTRAERYLKALADVAGDKDPVFRTVKDAMEKQRRSQVARAAREKKEQEKAEKVQEEADQLYREQMERDWLRKYEGGGTIYCGLEKYTYSQGGHVERQDGPGDLDWNGMALSGSLLSGWGSWDGASFTWETTRASPTCTTWRASSLCPAQRASRAGPGTA